MQAGQARVSLRFTEPSQEEALGEQTLRALRGNLASGVSACLERLVPPESVTAALVIQPLGDTASPRGVRIEVADHATQKQLARDLRLDEFPEDSQALALAVALDELLRASWLELALEGAKEKPREVPKVVQQAAETEVRSAAEELGPSRDSLPVAYFAQLSGRAFTAGEAWLGPDIGLTLPVAGRVAITTTVGARRGPFHRTELGRVRLTGAAASLTARYALLLDQRYDLSLDLGVAAMVAQVGAIARGATADSVASYAENTIAAWGGLQLGASVGLSLSDALRLRLATGLGLSVFPIVVVDDGGPSLDTRGLQVMLSLGLEVHP